jgi:nucleotide-binding universal stress UspA family protein
VRYHEHVAQVLGREKEVFDEFLAKIELHGVGVEILLEESTHTPQAILRVASRQQSDLIVMNTRGRSRAAAILLGSITSKTMEESPVPVLVVKHYGKKMSLVQAMLNHRTWEERSPKAN